MTDLSQAYRRRLREAGIILEFEDQSPEWESSIWTRLAREADPDKVNHMIQFVKELDEKGISEEVKKNTRVLEQMRVYRSFEQVGTEQPDEWLERLATVQARGGEYLGDRLPHLQKMVAGRAKVVEDLFAKVGRPVKVPVFWGIYPTSEFNARAEPEEDGALILINVGLFDLVWSFWKIHMASATVNHQPPLIDKRQAEMLLTETINAYLNGGGAADAQLLPILPEGDRQVIAERNATLCEQFVMAHELAHVVAGHLIVAPDALPRPTMHNVKMASYESEFEADRIASEAMLTLLHGVPKDSRLKYHLVGSIMLFFTLSEFVSSISERWFQRQSVGTHPPAIDRVKRIQEHLKEVDLSPDVFDLGLAYSLWLGNHLPGIVDRFSQIEAYAKTPRNGR